MIKCAPLATSGGISYGPILYAFDSLFQLKLTVLACLKLTFLRDKLFSIKCRCTIILKQTRNTTALLFILLTIITKCRSNLRILSISVRTGGRGTHNIKCFENLDWRQILRISFSSLISVCALMSLRTSSNCTWLKVLRSVMMTFDPNKHFYHQYNNLGNKYYLEEDFNQLLAETNISTNFCYLV